eukprot:TRINITY_DN60066_c0_g1_i1.p1 TRINITY_DN60066_c0_g1~~TRINITY_DN60066_c0_g1_i1.p1  ORF type:complete len:396 (+),score=101.03 TRINITY_DN60066_c0_g1_i1:118-1305(+)
MIRRPPRSTLSSSSAASDVYKRQHLVGDLLTALEGQAGDDPLFGVASHRWKLRVFIRKGGEHASIQEALEHCQSMLGKHQSVVFQCQLRYEIGQVLLSLGRHEEGLHELSTVAELWGEVKTDSCCRVDEGRLKSLCKAARSALYVESGGPGKEAGTMATVDKLCAESEFEQLARLILDDAFSAHHQIPVMYCDTLSPKHPLVAAASLLHRLMCTPHSAPFCSTALKLAGSTPASLQLLRNNFQRVSHERPHLSQMLGTVMTLIGEPAPSTDPPPPFKRVKRSALQRLVVHTTTSQFQEAAHAAESLDPGELELQKPLIWKAALAALRAHDSKSAGRMVKVLEAAAVSYTHLRAHETPEHLVCRLLLEKKKHTINYPYSVPTSHLNHDHFDSKLND